jgi:hypothetical protein
MSGDSTSCRNFRAEDGIGSTSSGWDRAPEGFVDELRKFFGRLETER